MTARLTRKCAREGCEVVVPTGRAKFCCRACYNEDRDATGAVLVKCARPGCEVKVRRTGKVVRLYCSRDCYWRHRRWDHVRTFASGQGVIGAKHTPSPWEATPALLTVTKLRRWADMDATERAEVARQCAAGGV